MSVALLPYYENAGSALKDERNHILDSLLCNSLESLSLLEEMTRTNTVQTVLIDCTKADHHGGVMLVLRERCRHDQ